MVHMMFGVIGQNVLTEETSFLVMEITLIERDRALILIQVVPQEIIAREMVTQKSGYIVVEFQLMNRQCIQQNLQRLYLKEIVPMDGQNIMIVVRHLVLVIIKEIQI